MAGGLGLKERSDINLRQILLTMQKNDEFNFF
jgi:hypothetical protein